MPRVERWLLLFVTLAVVVPVLAFPYPPMTDLPHHEAVVAILRHGGDAARYPPGIYVHNFGHPNQLFQLGAWLLSYAFGVPLACKLVVALAAAGVLWGGARLAKSLGASLLPVIALAPIATGFLFTMGLVNNLLGLALLLAVLPELDALVTTPSKTQLARVLLAGAALYVAHELMLFVFLAAAGLFAVVAPKEATRRGRIFAFVLVLSFVSVAVTQLVLQESLKPLTLRASPNVFVPPWRKLASMAADLVGAHEAPLRYGLAFAMALGLLAVHLSRHAPTERASLWERRHALVGALVFAWYLFAPADWNGATLVHHRFLAPSFFLLAIPLGRRATPRLVPSVVCGLAGLSGIVATLPLFVESSRDRADVLSVLQTVPLGSAVVGLALQESKRPMALSALTSTSLAERGGRVHHGFVHSTVSPIMVAKDKQWGEAALRLKKNAFALLPAHDLTRFRYALLRSDDTRLLEMTVVALLPDAKLVSTEGAWALMESRHPIGPIDGGDMPVPEPRPASLGDKMRALEDAARGRR
ncbi:MAG: hypothetical protein IPG50_16940 [Myxococcales bacterium]|nr:hypothetical protein [Myxococcales bacterium]